MNRTLNTLFALAVACAVAAPLPALAARLDVNQVSWVSEDDRVFHPSSDSGEYVLTLEPTDIASMTRNDEFGYWIGYLNVVVARPGGGGREWVVRNFPVIVNDSQDLLGQLPTTLDGPLPGRSIETLSTLEVGFAIEPEPVTGAPVYAPNPVVVEPVQRLFGGVAADRLYRDFVSTTAGLDLPWFLRGVGPVARPLVNNMFGISGGDAPPVQFGEKSKVAIDEKDIQRLDEKPWHCTPGSMARSFRYMADAKTITLEKTIADIEKELEGDLQTGKNVKGTRPQDMVPGAEAFIKRNDLGLVVESTGDGRVAQEALKNGADVTMHFQMLAAVPVQVQPGLWVRQFRPVYGHSVFVSEMQPVLNADKELIGYKITALDDARQGAKNAKDRRRVYSVDVRTSSLVVYDRNNRVVETGFLDPTSRLIVKKKKD